MAHEGSTTPQQEARASDSTDVMASPDRLQARIEGLRDGVARGIDYPMVRKACDDGRAGRPSTAP